MKCASNNIKPRMMTVNKQTLTAIHKSAPPIPHPLFKAPLAPLMVLNRQSQGCLQMPTIIVSEIKHQK